MSVPLPLPIAAATEAVRRAQRDERIRLEPFQPRRQLVHAIDGALDQCERLNLASEGRQPNDHGRRSLAAGRREGR